ncbi:MAG: hypothetical protein AAF431_00265 [Pseudomonadota bacterium]
MSFSVALLTFGVILLLVGIAGKIQAKELSVGTDSPASRVVVGILGAMLIVVALSQEGINFGALLGGDDDNGSNGSPVAGGTLGLLNSNVSDDSKDDKSAAETQITDDATAKTAALEEALAKAQAEKAEVEAAIAREREQREAERRRDEAAQSEKLIRVLQSSYGILREYCDPTEKIKSICDERMHCQVKIDNTLCGDPLKNEEKEGRIVYLCGEQEKTTVTPEEEIAYLSCE